MAYTPPAGDAADLSWVGQSVYIAPAGDAANFSFVELAGELPVYVLRAIPPAFPVQPAAVSLSLTALAPIIDKIMATTVLSLAAFAPEIIVGAIFIPLSIEFRHVTPSPWIMTMTSPVYVPAVTLTQAAALPGVTIRGFWSPHDMLFGWGYDEGTDTISIPLSTLFELTAGQAHATDGDWRAVVLALVNSMWDSYVELDDPPRALVLDYNPGYMMTAGPFTGAVKAEYTATTFLNFPEKTLADEP